MRLPVSRRRYEKLQETAEMLREYGDAVGRSHAKMLKRTLKLMAERERARRQRDALLDLVGGDVITQEHCPRCDSLLYYIPATKGYVCSGCSYERDWDGREHHG